MSEGGKGEVRNTTVTMSADGKSEISTTVERTTVVRKSMQRTIWTAKYEGLKVDVSLEEEITWTDLKERQKKLDAISIHVANELKRTLNTACDELGLGEKKVFASKDPKKDDSGGATVDNDIFDGI
jgi:hypothetical protein